MSKKFYDENTDLNNIDSDYWWNSFDSIDDDLNSTSSIDDLRRCPFDDSDAKCHKKKCPVNPKCEERCERSISTLSGHAYYTNSSPIRLPLSSTPIAIPFNTIYSETCNTIKLNKNNHTDIKLIEPGVYLFNYTLTTNIDNITRNIPNALIYLNIANDSIIESSARTFCSFNNGQYVLGNIIYKTKEHNSIAKLVAYSSTGGTLLSALNSLYIIKLC